MLAKLTEKEHRSPEMQSLFRRITEPLLRELLSANAFAEVLRPAFMQEVLRLLSDQSREAMEAMALRFGEPKPEEMPFPVLKALLIEKAKEYNRLKSEVEALRGASPRINDVLSLVEAELGKLSFAEAEALLASVRETTTDILRIPLETNAKVMEAQAGVALLRGNAKDAFSILSAAANSFAALDAIEPARRRTGYVKRLFEHGKRYGGDGLAFAEEMCRQTLRDVSVTSETDLWAKTQGNLASIIAIEAHHLSGRARNERFIAASKAFEETLDVWTSPAYPIHWARTKSNLAAALLMQGEYLGGEYGSKLLRDAQAACRDALTVLTQMSDPEVWAATKNTLGGALSTQGALDLARGTLDLESSAVLFREAILAFRAAQRVWNETTHPEEWAMVQGNRAVALSRCGERRSGAEGAAILGKAVAAYREEAREWREDTYPLHWASTNPNLGGALLAQGKLVGGQEGVALFFEAIAACEASLRVWTKKAFPAPYAKTTENLGRLCETLADADACLDKGAALRDADRYYLEAARSFDALHDKDNHIGAVGALLGVRLRLREYA